MPSPATLSFDSIAALRAYTTTAASHETVQLLGYYNPGDGGGGEFYWDSASTGTDDGGSIIQQTSLATGRWMRVFTSSQISVKAFGATGDNSTDDSFTIQKASDYCSSLITGGLTATILYFPPSAGYSTSTTITAKSRISVWMEANLILNNSAFDRPCLQIGETGITNSGLNFRLRIGNKTTSPWGNYTSCIGVNFTNVTASNISLDNIAGFTIGCQLTSDTSCQYNNLYIANMTDNQKAFNFTSSGSGFVNENVFIGGNYGTTSNTSGAPWNAQSRWGVYALAPGSMNQNVFYKPCFQLGATTLLTGTSIDTLNNLVGGTGYTNGTYTSVPLTGGTGSGALATIVVSSANVSFVQITFPGLGYAAGDTLSASAASIGGTGSGFTMTISTVAINPTAIGTFSFTQGTSYTNGTYTNVPLTGGTGSAAQATITIAGNKVTKVQLTAIGIGYILGDILSASAASIGGTGSGFTLTVNTVIVSPTALSAGIISAPGSSYTNGTYSNVALIGGTGSGAKATITVSSNVVSKVQLTVIGVGYTIGDALSATATNIGGTGSGFAYTVTALSGGALGVPVYLDNASYFSFNNCRVESCSNIIVQVRNSAAGNSFSIDYFNSLGIYDPQEAVDDASLVKNTVVKFNWLPEADATGTLIYKSPLLVTALAPYGSGQYNIKGLDWVKKTDGSIKNGSTITSIGSDYIELSASDTYYPSITVNTVTAKRFLVKVDTVYNRKLLPSQFGGKVVINCYDNSGTIIDPTVISNILIQSHYTTLVASSTAYGKSYSIPSDLNVVHWPQFYFNVDVSVAKIRIIFAPGTENLKLRQFSIYALDNRSESGFTSNSQTDDFIGLASAIPTTAYPKGTYVKNDFSVDTKSQFWYNSDGSTSGWKTSNDFNTLVNSPIYSGNGTPNGVVTAPIGSLYLNTGGAAGTTLYVKESGAGNTGWVGK